MTKLKRTTPMIYQGREIYVYSDKQNGTVMICHSRGMEVDAEYENVKLSDLKPVKKINQPIKKSTKTASTQKNNKKDLDLFFEKMALRMPANCESCGKKLMAFNNFAKKCVTAHILPKSKFKSVATNENNVMFLGAGLLGGCNCHDNWDGMGAEDRAKMPCYDLATERFLKMVLDISDTEFAKALKYLNIQ